MSPNSQNFAAKIVEPSVSDDRVTVKSLRETRGYSIEDLAVTCGLANSEISDIEDGRAVDPANLKRIAAALRVSVSDLMEWADPDSGTS